jgi:hypothetical protein
VPPRSLDAQIIQLFKDANPSGAYLVGDGRYAGRMSIPSKQNLARQLKGVRAMRRRAETDLQRKSLDSFEAGLLMDEPQPVLDELVGVIFAHMVKEGFNEKHLLSIMKDASAAIDAVSERFAKRKIPVGVKALTLYRLGGVQEVLNVVKSQSKSKKVGEACDALLAKASAFVDIFRLEGFGHGEFPNVEKVFRREGFELGREKFYPTALKKGFDYSETPAELERNGLKWLDEELPLFRKATSALAKMYGCEAAPEAVEEKLNARLPLDPKKLLAVTMEARKVVQAFINEDVSGVNPKYRTTAIETPDYLTGMIPTGAAQFFDTFTKKPFQYYFQTTDPRRDPDKAVASLLSLLVHEEFGHCLHHSNSALGFMGKVPPLQLLPLLATSGPITEGLSFNRELEFLEASKRLEGKRKLSRAEAAYVKLLGRYGGLRTINKELEFVTRRERVVRFLRVIGDVRVNTGSQGLIEFVDWAHAHTGVPRSKVYFQLFPAHEGIGPGYATTYAVMGQQIRAMEKKIKDPKKLVKFSTYLCSVGFPPRSIYTRMLKEYARKL